MTKRFKLSEPNGAYLVDGDKPCAHWINDDDKIIDLLNEQHEQINTLRESRRELISANNDYRMRETELAQELSALVDENEQLEKRLQIYKSDGLETLERLQRCYNNSKKAMKTIDALDEENEQLKQRNNRQAKQLDRLYNLIEEKDWRTLTDILDDFKRCEEQLQREWKCYDD